jgi:hypothetical protein
MRLISWTLRSGSEHYLTVFFPNLSLHFHLLYLSLFYQAFHTSTYWSYYHISIYWSSFHTSIYEV